MDVLAFVEAVASRDLAQQLCGFARLTARLKYLFSTSREGGFELPGVKLIVQHENTLSSIQHVGTYELVLYNM